MPDEFKPPVELVVAHSWSGLVGKWLFQQGVSTILLFAILYAAWEGIPVWNAATQDGYAQMHDRFSADLKMLAEQMVKDQEKDRQLFERLLQEVRANRRATEALKEP